MYTVISVQGVAVGLYRSKSRCEKKSFVDVEAGLGRKENKQLSRRKTAVKYEALPVLADVSTFALESLELQSYESDEVESEQLTPRRRIDDTSSCKNDAYLQTHVVITISDL